VESRKKIWLGAGLLLLAGLFIYWPALQGGWIWDDELEIAKNPVLTAAHGWWSIWLRPEGPDYYPLKTSLQWCEWQLWGGQVLYYHLVSLGCHVLAAFLFWRVLGKLNIRGAYWAALIFVIHPLCVESVAWISELKNVMSLPLLLLAMGAFLDCEETGRGRWRAPLWFLAAMLTKSSVVMFPFVLLLYAWWRRGRIKRWDVQASLPFFGISLVLGVVTTWFQSHRAIAGMDLHLGGPLWRLGSAAMAVVFYFGKCLLPVVLMPIYPDWGAAAVGLQPALCSLLLLVAWALLGRQRQAYGRAAWFGGGFFLLNLLPVLGFIPMSYLRLSRVADHLCYLPLLGLVALAATGLSRRVSAGFIAGLCLVLALVSREQAKIYRSPAAFWSAAVARNPAAWLAQNSLGSVLIGQGKLAAAETHFRAALQLKPDYAEAENNWGSGLLRFGRLEAAKVHLERAIRLQPDYAEAYNDLGDVYVQSGRYPQAIGAFGQAMGIKPDDAEAYSNRGLAFSSLGRQEAAIADFETALRLNPALAERPDFLAAHNNLGNALFRSGHPREAMAEYETVLRLDPQSVDAQNNLALARRALPAARAAGAPP
jgi:tetratricopeptide (TPR) repeat protein